MEKQPLSVNDNPNANDNSNVLPTKRPAALSSTRQPTNSDPSTKTLEDLTDSLGSADPRELKANEGLPLGADGEDVTSTEPVSLNAPPAPDPNVVTLDANGPYGTMADPLYEGDTVDFQATLSGAPDPSLYNYRWDVQNDGAFETGWQASPDYTYNFLDNNVGLAKVQAWDGSYTTAPGELFGSIGVAGIYYLATLGQWNQGLRVTPTQTITITDLGAFRYEPAPRHIPYRVGLWTSGGALLRDCMLDLSPGSSVWRYCAVAPYTLTAGTTYVISLHTQTSNYRFWATENAVPPSTYNFIQTFTPGNLLPSRYLSSASFLFPTITDPYTCGGADCLAAIDAKFTYSTPNIVSDTADVFVDNVAPGVGGLSASPVPGQEGNAMTFNGFMDDPGLDDTWESRWCFPTGCTAWQAVSKYSGGAKVLLYHSADLYMPAFRTSLIAACGPFCLSVDSVNMVTTTLTLAQLMAYDVVFVDTYSGATPAGTGDLLADYMDAKGNTGTGGVIVTGRGPYNPGMWQITGRYFNQQYSPVPYGVSQWLWKNIGMVYDPTHPILSGVAALSSYPHSQMFTVNPGATRLADWTDGAVLLATKTNPTVPNGARAVAMPFRVANTPAECTGSCIQLALNAIKWASRQSDPIKLSMPLALPPTTWRFPDDDPTHVTPEDLMNAELQVRDDDHLRTFQVGAATTLMTQDFTSATFPPTGWFRTHTNWQRNAGNVAGGSAGEAMYFWSPSGVKTARLYTTVDTTGYGGYQITFREFLDHFGGPYRVAVQTSADGTTWTTVWEVVNPTGNYGPRLTGPIISSANAGGIMYVAWVFDGESFNIDYWFVDNIVLAGINVYTMDGYATDSIQVLVQNVEPTAVVPPALQGKVVDENTPITFQGIQITDPALMEETESFWYKVDFDDGTVSDWIYKGVIATPKLKILLYHSLGTTEAATLRTAMLARLPAGTIVDTWDFLTAAQGPGSVSLLANYDVVVVGINWAPYDGVAVGNVLAGYADLGGNIVETVAAFHTNCGWWGICGNWRTMGYTTLQNSATIGANQAVQTIYDPNHPIIKGQFGTVTTFSAGIPVGMTAQTPGSTLLARYPSYPAIAYNDLGNPNAGLGRTVGINSFYYPGYYGTNELTLLLNAIWWASQVFTPTPVLDPLDHNFMDNGKYFVDYQIIDDDMNWVWDFNDPTPDDPVYVGPGEPQISHNIVQIEVYNTDPVIDFVRAFVTGDLCLRLTGNSGNEVTLELFDGTDVHQITLVRDAGNPEFLCLEDVDIDMEVTAGSYVKLIYDPADGDGANPSWMVEGYWPGDDPHKIHVVFNAKGGHQEQFVSFGDLFVGVPIHFSVLTDDVGSDDLALVWNWGDTTPMGVHLYANVGGPFVEGVTDEYQHIFDQLGDDRDPWFDRPDNSIRSPDGTPITVDDTQTHVFSDYYFYYVMLTVMDDDVNDGYPSPYLHDGTDMEMLAINLS